jgi:ribosomal protein L28
MIQQHTNQFTDTVQGIRVNLQVSAEALRKMDTDEAERVAANLDRLRVFLKRYLVERKDS